MKYWNSLNDLIAEMRANCPIIDSLGLKQLNRYVIFCKEVDGKKVYGVGSTPKKIKVDNVSTWNLSKEVWPEAFSKKSMLEISLRQLDRMMEEGK